MASKGSTGRDNEEWDQAAPRRMMRELGLLENLARDLIHTLGKCSLPLGFRQSTGSQIHTLIQKILEVNQKLKVAQGDVAQHQEKISYGFAVESSFHRPFCWGRRSDNARFGVR
jgi:hypothetical protein